MSQNKIVKHLTNDGNFTVIVNEIIRGGKLGVDAYSCYSLIKSHSESNYEFHTQEFTRVFQLTKERYRKAMNILEELGLVFSIKKRLPQGKGFYYTYHVFDTMDYETNFEIAHLDSISLDSLNLKSLQIQTPYIDTLKKHNDIRRTTEEEKPKEQKKKKKKERIQASPLFTQFHKKFRGKKNGADTHYTDFVERYDDHKEIELLLNDAIDYQIELRKKEVANGQSETYWKNLSTWLNQRCWEETNPEIEEPLEVQTKKKSSIFYYHGDRYDLIEQEYLFGYYYNDKKFTTKEVIEKNRERFPEYENFFVKFYETAKRVTIDNLEEAFKFAGYKIEEVEYLHE